MADSMEFNWLINRAWTRDDTKVYTGEALLIALLMHTHGDSRDGEAMAAVQKIMKDVNADLNGTSKTKPKPARRH